MINKYPKRLIEVDLPIKRISAHARREKSIRHGHISTLHIWWARRPLAACRAVICAALWIDPADPLCPQVFRDQAMKLILDFAKKAVSDKDLGEHCSEENWAKWNALVKQEEPLDSKNESHLNVLRFALLDFIADFANWDNSTVKEYLETSRALTQAAHEALGGEKGTRPLVVDPFAGGGSIPLEALRIGADAFASDLNPIPFLLNKVLLEYIPKYRSKLSDEVRKWGQWVKEHTEKELEAFYPKDDDGAIPIAYLWARTIKCEGPGCGTVIPMIRNLWVAKKDKKGVALRLIPNLKEKRIDIDIIERKEHAWVKLGCKNTAVSNPKFDGTIKRGSVTCPCCGFTTPVSSVRIQLREKHGGTNDALLLCVVTTKSDEKGRLYRLPTSKDYASLRKAAEEKTKLQNTIINNLSQIPTEPLPPQGTLGFRVQLYGILQWGELFTNRQLLALTTLVKYVNQVSDKIDNKNGVEFKSAVQTCLSFLVDKMSDKASSLCRWKCSAEYMAGNTFGRQALPMVWDFCEASIIGKVTGDIGSELDWICQMLTHGTESLATQGRSERCSATNHPLSDDSVSCFFTDPPYYDAVPYADLSDFFYVWLKRSLPAQMAVYFKEELTLKDDECIVDAIKSKDRAFFERTMSKAMMEGRRILSPSGIGVVVFAHKSTRGWEAQLQAMVEAGWIITGSWPIDTEMGSRLRAMDSAALASSIHLVCRPRDGSARLTNQSDGSVSETDIGDWRDVLQELPKRIHDWMPRLAHEGVVGADAIFACLGPALEIFSRYSRVEKASGETVSLKEYLEHVWAVVAKEALDMVFSGAQTSDFEEDARLTAMWLWTLSTGGDGNGAAEETENESTDDEESGSSKKPAGGFVLEFDAARKIAQGLGAHLEQLQNLVEAKGETARLLPVSERARYLFGKDAVETPKKKKKKSDQTNLFAELGIEEEGSTGFDLHASGKIGETVLDRLHQSMILFATGRSEALKRFIVEDGVGQDQRFWRLAQAFSALYPSSSEEKRWVDGVLARKKGLGF